MPTPKDYLSIGVITRTHGLHGAIKIKFKCNLAVVEQLDYFFLLIDSKYIPFFIKNITLSNSDIHLILLDEIDSREKAHNFVGKEVFVLYDKKYVSSKSIFSQLVGFHIKNNEIIDPILITDIYDLPTNPLLEIRYHDNTILLPYVSEWIEDINQKQRTLIYNFPIDLLSI